MDFWTDKQLELLKAGGNQRCQEWFAANGISINTRSHKAKYDNDIAKFYSEVLKARVEGRSEPKLRQGKWNQPSEWYRMLVPGTGSRKDKTILQGLVDITSKPDIWLYVYGASVVGWAVIYIGWKLGVLKLTFY